MPKIEGYDEGRNYYRGKKVIWDNISYFQIWFLECQYKFAKNQKRYLENEEIKDSLPEKQYLKEKKEISGLKKEIIQEAKDLFIIIFSIRYTIYQLYNTSPGYKKAIDDACREDFVLWINTFAWTYDPRMTAYGLPPKLPLVLTPKQQHILSQVEDGYKNNLNILIEKSRAEGLTEILAAWDIHKWLFVSGYKSGWGSRKEELVDKIGEPDTIFARLRRMIYALPKKMRPKGYGRENNSFDNRMRLVNPDNGAVLSGEGGINIGRGGRSSNYKVDEYAKVDSPRSIDESLSYNTNSLIYFSTPYGMNQFYQHRKSGKWKVITAGWWSNPAKNDKWQDGVRNESSEWYKLQHMLFDPVTIAQEIDIDYNASVEDVFIPSKWVTAAIDLQLPGKGFRASGFDIAAGGEDIAAYVQRESVTVQCVEKCNGVTPIDSTWDAAEKSERDEVGEMRFDQNTIGEDVYPVLTRGEREIKFELIGEYGQGAASEDKVEGEKLQGNQKFRNRRAELWWNLRVRFRKTYEHVNKIRFYSTSELISIPNHRELIAELSAPKLLYTTSGKIGVESKREMKSRGVKSPNYADALTYCFAGTVNDVGLSVIARENKKDFLQATDFQIDLNKGFYHYYISFYQTNEGQLFCLLVQQDMSTMSISVIKEFQSNTIDPEIVMSEIRAFSKSEIFTINEWIGNDAIFDGIDKGEKTTWYQFKKAGIRIKQNYFNNYAGALSIANNLFKNGNLRAHKNCTQTVDQIKTWDMKNGKPLPGYNYAQALLQLMTYLKRKKKVKVEYKKPLKVNGYKVNM